MSQLERYVERYGEAAGPKLYHAVRSRSAYMGANARRRATIAALTGKPTRRQRAISLESPPLPLFRDELGSEA